MRTDSLKTIKVMEPTIMDQLIFEKSSIQQLKAKAGPFELAASYERITKLVWALLQTDPSHLSYSKAWEMLVDCGEQELRSVLQSYQVSGGRKYIKFYNRLVFKISLALSILP